MREGGREIQGKDGIAAFSGAVLDYIFPLFLVVVLLRLGPRIPRGEIERLRIGGPGEGVNLFLSLGYCEGLSSAGGNQVDLADAFVFLIAVRIVALLRGCLALGQKCDPASVRRPLGIGIVAGLS